jgi:hypothetical protein
MLAIGLVAFYFDARDGATLAGPVAASLFMVLLTAAVGWLAFFVTRLAAKAGAARRRLRCTARCGAMRRRGRAGAGAGRSPPSRRATRARWGGRACS